MTFHVAAFTLGADSNFVGVTLAVTDFTFADERFFRIESSKECRYKITSSIDVSRMAIKAIRDDSQRQLL